MGIIVGAYPNSPARDEWNPSSEEEYFQRLGQLPGFRGLELPWIGTLHPHDDGWLLDHLDARWDLVLTNIRYSTLTVARSPNHGLASDDEGERRAAVENVRRMNEGVKRLNDAAGRRAVIAIEFQAAPQRGSTASLARSLDSIDELDWEGASLLIEHCDALVPEHPPTKGFLTLEEEIAAIRSSATPFGISLNWGRSALELRSADRVVDHVRRATDEGLLRSIVFSGVSDVDSSYGQAWADTHLPFGATDGFDKTEDTSLLSVDQASSALAAAGELDWVGLKVSWRPREVSMAERVELIRQTITIVEQAAANAGIETIESRSGDGWVAGSRRRIQSGPGR